ncbi:hypothetical protein AB0D14_05160 [Streptomyces sp. NPDC048484]|uniref:hypothetical protein n=1 Tax=Streptomyces sp. NPDC048484 TaxID=3155146 RepID=UPI0034145E11
MAFGKQSGNSDAEVPVEPVAWATVREFVIGSVERPLTPKRKRVVRGPRAVRVPKGGKDSRVLAPCAFLGRSDHAGLPSRPELTLYEDIEGRSLLCYVDSPKDVDGEQHHVVHDRQGQVIGTIRRVPPKRPFKHTWRMDQPGHPEIAGRNEWASGDAKEVAGRAAGKFALGVVGAIANLGAEGGDQRSKPRSLEWRADDKVVMVSEGSEKVTVRADWLDRRLAFAFALVSDQ